MERIKRGLVLFTVVFGFLGISSCRQHHGKKDSHSRPWFPVQFTTPLDNSIFLLSHTKHNSTTSSLSKGLHADQIIGVVGNQQTSIHATYGPYEVAETINGAINISTHFAVKTEILTKNLQIHDPTIRVLFRLDKEDSNTNGANERTQESLPCVKLILKYGERQLSSACRMQGGVLACVVKVPIPVEWWSTMMETDSLKAYYSIFDVEDNAPCLLDNLNAIPPRDGAPVTPSPEYYVGEIQMGSSYDAFRVNREDQYVWIHSPTAEFGTNAKFQIPVSILSNFTATGCVIRAKARQGLRVVAVHTIDNALWSISSRVNPKGSLAMITMIRKEATTAAMSYDGLASNVDIEDPQRIDGLAITFTIEFEVHNGTDELRPINWRIDYEEEMHTMQVRTEVGVRPHDTQALMSIVKDGNLVNTAVLNGIRVNKPMTVLAATYTGKVLDVTGQATCSSSDTSVVKVDTHCRHIYVDGTETSGSLSVGIQVSYEGQTTQELLSLWMPEFPLDVELDDDELGMIRGWKVPSRSRKRVARQAESLDKSNVKKQNGKNKPGKCHLRYQTSRVHVYTRFYATHDSTDQIDKKVYLFGKHMRAEITDIVQDQITTADTSIASIKQGQLIATGRTVGSVLVKVLTPYGSQSLGERVATVVDSKVTAEFHLSMVTGMSMKIHPVQLERSDILRVKVRARDQISTEKQEVLFDGFITFSDGTSTNLQNVRVRDFAYSLKPFDTDMFYVSLQSSFYNPGLIAVREGITYVKMELNIPTECDKFKNDDVIASDIMQINVSFTGHHSLPSNQLDSKKRVSLTNGLGPVDYGNAIPGFDPEDPLSRDDVKNKGSKKGGISSIPIDSDINELSPRYSNDKYDEHVDYNEGPDLNFFNEEEGKLTPLEIGMYVLLAIFCIAILAFLINCIIFMARYRRSKRVPGVGQSTYPQNWVLFSPDEGVPAPMASPEEMVPLQRHPGEDVYVGSPECTESDVSIERHSNNDCGMHNSRDTTIPCTARIYDGTELCDCCQGVCECEMDTAMHDCKSEDDAQSDRGSVSICSSESREKLQNNAAADCCNNENTDCMQANPVLDDHVDSNTAEFSVAIAPEEPSTSTEATDDLEDPGSELRITLNPTAECSIESPQDEGGFDELLDYLSELQETCA